AWILDRSAGRAADDRFSQRFIRFYNSDASLEPPTNMQGDENSMAFRKDSVMRNRIREFLSGNGFDDGSARQLQCGTSLGFREGRHPGTSCAPQACGGAGAA